jgi:hypothetical protein
MSYKNLSTKLQPCYDHFIPLVRYYWHNVIKNIADLLTPGCSKTDLILDYGCGEKQRLKKYLPEYNIIGYDIVKEFSDTDDFKQLKPGVIVCSHVLEHLEKKEFLKTLSCFKKMSPKFIITAQPTENILSKICNLLAMPRHLKKDLTLIDHKLKINEVHNAFLESFELKARKNIFTLTVISKWIPKD